MNNPNPFHPQVSLLEQKNRKRARVKVAVFSIFAFNILLISPLLIQGCRDKQASSQTDATSTAPTNGDTTSTTTADTSNTAPPLPVPATNPVVPPIAVQPPVVVPPTPTATDYVIVKGDTFSKIAHEHGVSVKALMAANPGLDPAKLQIGKKVEIPAPSAAAPTANTTSGTVADSGDVYVVKSGDSLSKIAREHNTTVKAIRSANDLKTNKILVGQKLKMPAAGSATPTPPASADAAPPSAAPSTSTVTTASPPPASGGTGH